MKRLLWIGLLIALFAPLLALAQSPLDGTWRFNLDNAQFPKKPDVFLLKDGTYACKTCVPPWEVKADGQDHPVSGHPYFDTVSITVIDDHSIEETDKKNGKTVTTTRVTLSPDGKTLTADFHDSSASETPVTGKAMATRVATGPSGSHAVSGSWRTTKVEGLSENGLTVTYKVDGDMITMTSPTGQSYTAKLDGADAPYKGDPGTTSVSMKRINDHSFVETDKRDGKVIGVSQVTVSADGKTLNLKNEDKLHGTTSEFSANKQ